MTIREDEGITGVTFRSDGNQLVGVLYLARGGPPKPTVLLLHGCPGLEKNQLAVTPAELRHQAAASTWQRPADLDGANHAFAWHRAALRNLVAGWLVETGV